jgi:uncharacterized membrane protein YbhN (UPF0104 family)
MLLLKYGLGLGLLAWVIYKYWDIQSPEGESVGLSTVFEKRLHWQFLILAFVISLASLLLTFLRWFFLVRAQDLPFSLVSALRLGMVGNYFNTFLPGGVGGDIVKAAFVAREQNRRTVAVATIIVDRIIGLCGLVWLVALVGGIFWLTGTLWEVTPTQDAAAILESIFLGALGLTTGMFGFWFVIGFLSDERSQRLSAALRRIPKVGGMAGELWRACWLYRRRGWSIATALALSMVGHFGFVLVFYCGARTLNDQIPTLEAHLLIIPVGMIVEVGIPTPGGIGGGEFVFGTLYKILGYSFAAGVLGRLMRRCVDWILGLTGYLIYLRMKPETAREVPPPQEAPEVPSDLSFRAR